MKRSREGEDSGEGNTRPRSRQRNHPPELDHHVSTDIDIELGFRHTGSGAGVTSAGSDYVQIPAPQVLPSACNQAYSSISTLPDLVITNSKNALYSAQYTAQAQCLAKTNSTELLSPWNYTASYYQELEHSGLSPAPESSRGGTPDTEHGNHPASPSQCEIGSFPGSVVFTV